MRVFLFIGVFITTIVGFAAAANAKDPSRSFGKGTAFDANNEYGLVTLSYHYSGGEEAPPFANFAKIDPVTGEYLEEFWFYIGSGLGFGRARYLRKQGYDFVKSGTHFATRRFEPGLYVALGVKRTGDLLSSSTSYGDMTKATFAFTVEAGKVNYLGDFVWGVRSRNLCSLTRGEYDEAPTAYKNDEEGLCYAKFRNEDNAKAKANQQNGESGNTEGEEPITPESDNNPARLVFATATAYGLADYRRIYGQAAEKRIGLMRAYLAKYRPKVGNDVEIILSDRVDVTLERNVVDQIFETRKKERNSDQAESSTQNQQGDDQKGGDQQDQSANDNRPSHLDQVKHQKDNR